MYSKDELSDKNTSELQDIATGLGLNVQDYTNNDELVYAILDRQAEVEGNKNPLGGTKRRRTRIVKKDTDKVYTVNGSEGENFDIKKNKTATTSNTDQPKTVEPEEVSPSEEDMSLEEQLKAIPKHRGRKSKKELELLSALEARKQQTPAEDAMEEMESAEENNIVADEPLPYAPTDEYTVNGNTENVDTDDFIVDTVKSDNIIPEEAFHGDTQTEGKIPDAGLLERCRQR